MIYEVYKVRYMNFELGPPLLHQIEGWEISVGFGTQGRV